MAYEEIKINDQMRLVQLQPDQADRLFELIDSSREHLAEYLLWLPHVQAVEDSRKYIHETLNSREKGITYTYGIEVDGEIVGDISLRNINVDADSRTEIGYWMAKDYTGKGIATIATQALTNFGINELGLEKIIIRADPNNIGSNKVAEKAGYTFEGQLDDEKYKKLNIWFFSF